MNFTDLSSVEKYVLPTETYECLPNSVLAWKKSQKLGRFDPNALSPVEAMAEQARKDKEEVEKRGKYPLFAYPQTCVVNDENLVDGGCC